jgi:chromosome segregation ATPase
MHDIVMKPQEGVKSTTDHTLLVQQLTKERLAIENLSRQLQDKDALIRSLQNVQQPMPDQRVMISQLEESIQYLRKQLDEKDTHLNEMSTQIATLSRDKTASQLRVTELHETV